MSIIFGLENYYYGRKRGKNMHTVRTARQRIQEGFEGANEKPRDRKPASTPLAFPTIEPVFINFNNVPEDAPVDGKSAAAGKD